MSETPEQRAASVEAVRFARREACRDVVEALDDENALLSDDNAWLRNEVARLRAALGKIAARCSRDGWPHPSYEHIEKMARAALERA